MSLTSFLCTVFKPCFCTLVANFKQVIVCWEGSYQISNFSKQDLIFHLILQLLKFEMALLKNIIYIQIH